MTADKERRKKYASNYKKADNIAYVGSGWKPGVDEFSQDLMRIATEADEAVMSNPDFFSWDYDERIYLAVKEQAYLIARSYGWTIEGGRIDE